MATFKKYKTGQSHGVVIDVGSYLAEGHLCKQVEKIVSTLDTSAIEASYSERGQNALHPKLMLSVIFYGYMEGIRSGRKLAKACKENLPFIYLSKGYQPKKSAINDFRKKTLCSFFEPIPPSVEQVQRSRFGRRIPKHSRRQQNRSRQFKEAHENQRAV